MAPRLTVLDASALVALLLGQAGDRVALAAIKSGAAHTTSTGLAEALNVLRLKGYSKSREETAQGLADLGLTVDPVTYEDAIDMAFLQAETERQLARSPGGTSRVGSLSLGDAACLAVARRLGAIAVMSDETWELLGSVGVEVQAFR